MCVCARVHEQTHSHTHISILLKVAEDRKSIYQTLESSQREKIHYRETKIKISVDFFKRIQARR